MTEEVREKESEKQIFEVKDRGFIGRAWYLKDTPTSKGDALVVISYGENVVRSFLWPAYKVWNIPAHFNDIVDGELSKYDWERGYRIAGSTGFGGCIMPIPFQAHESPKP